MTTFSAVAEHAVGEGPDVQVVVSLSCGSASFVVSGNATGLNVQIDSLQQPAIGGVAEFAVAETPPNDGIFLSADVAVFSILGFDAIGAQSSPTEAAAFTLTGGDAQIAWPHHAAAFVLAGQAAGGSAGFIADVAAFTLTGNTAEIAWAHDAVAFVLTGQDALSTTVTIFSAATFTLTGGATIANVDLSATLVGGEGAVAEFAVTEFPEFTQLGLYAEPAVFAINGQDVVARTFQVSEPAAFILTLVDAQQAWASDAATFVLTGQAVSLSSTLTSEPATFTLALVDAQQAWASDPAAFVLTGQDTVSQAYLAANAATFTLSLVDVLTVVTADVATFTISGSPTFSTPTIVAETAVFTLTGESADLLNIFRFYIDPGAFVLSGQDAGQVYTLGGETGVFTLAGYATFTSQGPFAGAAFNWQGYGVDFDAAFKIATGQFTILGWNIIDALGPEGDHIFLVEVKAHDGTEERTLYLSTKSYTSLPTDTPANQFYEPRVKDPGLFERTLFSQGAVRGRSSVGAGDIVVVNAPDENGLTLDEWLNYGWDGREIRIKALPVGARNLTAASTLFVGRLDKLISTKPLEEFSLRIADRLSDLDKPLLTMLFEGTTVTSEATVEGNADLKGKIKQRCYGEAREVPLQPANPYDLIYLASLGDEIQAVEVFDGGVPLTYDGTSASIAALRSASIPAGHYRRFKGYIRLGSSPLAALSANVTEGATEADRTAAQIAQRMLVDFGIPINEIITGAFSQLDAKNSAVCGYFVDDERTALSAVQDVLDSVNAWLVPNRDGSLGTDRFDEPASSPGLNFDIDELSIGNSLERSDARIPVYRVTVQYARVNFVQAPGSVAGSVSAARRAYLSNEWRTVVAEDPAVKVKHLNAQELTVTTYLNDEVDAQAEANRLLELYAAREIYSITMPLSDAWAADVGLAMTLNHPRLGLSGGKAFNIIGRVDEYKSERVRFSLWG